MLGPNMMASSIVGARQDDSSLGHGVSVQERLGKSRYSGLQDLLEVRVLDANYTGAA